MTKVFTEDGALELAERLLQNDKDIKDEFERKGYATETFVTNAIANAQLSGGDVDLSGYASKEDLNDYALKSQIPSLDGYAKTEDIPDEYDDTALSNRITTVENDYLKSSDKTELTRAIATAKTETIETILGESVDADFDTLQEVADWIQADTTASAELVIRVTDAESDIATIQNDYLKSVDKTELLSSISTNATAISKNITDIEKNAIAIEENAEAIADNTTAIAVERARINAFAALPEGSTTGDAALEDIKIKVDGTTSDTAGNAVREQINTLDDKIDEEVGKLSSEIEELDTACLMYTAEEWVFGTVKSETGKNASATDRLRLEKYVPLAFLKRVSILNGYKFKTFFYDENMVFVGTIDWKYSKLEKETMVSSFPTAKYMRIIIAHNLSSVTIDLSLVEESGIKLYMLLGKMVDTVYTDTAVKLSLEQYRKEKDYGVVFVAHQGMANSMPPNTKISFVEAIKFGCDAIETDVHFTSDNIPVLLHDETINSQARNADGTEITNTIAIATTTYADLLTYDFGIRYGYSGTKICTFYDYIDLCKVYGIVPYIELKSLMSTSQIEILLSYVEKRGIKKVVWSSTHSQNVKNISTLRDDLTIAYQQTAKRTVDDYLSGEYKWFYDMLAKHNCIVRVSKDYADMEYIDSLRELGFLITIGTMDNTASDITKSKTVLHGLDYYLHNHVAKNMIFDI